MHILYFEVQAYGLFVPAQNSKVASTSDIYKDRRFDSTFCPMSVECFTEKEPTSISLTGYQGSRVLSSLSLYLFLSVCVSVSLSPVRRIDLPRPCRATCTRARPSRPSRRRPGSGG